MSRRASAGPLVLALLAGCGTPGPPPSPPSLGYGTVAGAAGAVYAFGDTSRVEVDAAGETVDAGVSVAAALHVDFRSSPGGLTLSTSFRDVSARATHPFGTPRSVRVASFDEPLVFTLDRRGEPTVLSTPAVPEEAAHFLSPEATAATLFPRLPGRPVEPGHGWTDTLRVRAGAPGRRVEGTSVVTYTVVGDTVVGSRSLLHVTLEARDHREIRGTSSGVEVSQRLEGRSTGWFLWDLSGGLLHESVYDSDLAGTMELTEAPFPLSVRVRSRTEVRLVEAPPAPAGA